MLKKEITYETFDGETVTDTFYFNMTEAELIELQMGGSEAMDERLRRLIKTRNNADLFAMFKEIITVSVGEKSEDGRRFTKNEDIREAFVNSAAYSELFVELFTDVDKLTAFLVGILPRKFANDIEAIDPEKAMEEFLKENPDIAAIQKASQPQSGMAPPPAGASYQPPATS